MSEPTTLSLIEQVIRLGVPGVLLVGIWLLLRGDLVPKSVHSQRIADRDSVITEQKQQISDLNTAVGDLTKQQVASVQDLVATQKQVIDEYRKTNDSLLALVGDRAVKGGS